MSCITCVSLLPAISLMAADRYDPMLDFTSSQISWLFRLDPHLAFTSYSVRQNKGETGSHRHKHCAVPEEKLSFCFTSYCMGSDLLMEYINPPLTPKQCLPSAREGRKRRVRGPAMAPGPVGCSGLWRPGRCQAWPCAPGLRPSLRPPLLNQKNSFFFFSPLPEEIPKARVRCEASTRTWVSSPPGTGASDLREFGKSHISQESPRNSSSSLIWPYISYRLIISSQMKPSLWLRTQTARFLNFNYGVKIKIW